jgi:hypothetical protein
MLKQPPAKAPSRHARKDRRTRDAVESGDEVETSSELSFPASDPPSWTPTHPGTPGPADRAKDPRRGDLPPKKPKRS